ncbi:MAG: UvrB/UvrC motif-containing protein [Phycisphaerales bacterium]
MKCDQCDNEATVHDLSIKNGVKIERHLCEVCAAQHGLATQPSHQIGEVLKVVVGMPGIVPMTRTTSCPKCSMSFAEFKQHGLLGCAYCYEAFAAQLGPLLERAHDGAVRHTGKVPVRAAAKAGAAPAASRQMAEELERRSLALSMLRRQLDTAVSAEQYELAAKLRDDIRRMQEQAPPPVGP